MNIPPALLDYLSEFDNLALIAGPLLGVVLIVLLALKLLKNKYLINLMTKIKSALFWNYLIAYFQASYINYQFKSCAKLFNSDAILEKVMSGLIITLQTTVVIVIFRVLLKSNP